MRSAALGLAVVVCVLVPAVVQSVADARGGWGTVDFRAYYCAALAQRRGLDPYLVDSLHECESTASARFFKTHTRVTVPAPYPPYALALLAPLTLLPLSAAVVLWQLLLTACIAIAAWSLSRLIDRPFLVGLAAFGSSLGLTCLPGGNVMPLAVAAIVLAALFQQRRQTTAACACIAVAMVEPNVALPAAIGLFVTVGRSRAGLCIAAILLAAISIVAGGMALNVQYLRDVLPAHALSEISRDNQYSLSTVLCALGVADRAALLAGSLSYVAMVAFGTYVGSRLRRAYAIDAFAILIPVSFALIGGSFEHTEAIAAAIPAALLVLTQTSASRVPALGAALLLSVPWMFAVSVASFLTPLVPVAYLTNAVSPGRRVAWLSAAVAAFAIIAMLFVFARPSHFAIGLVPRSHPFIDPRLAEAAWRDFVLNGSTNRLGTWLLRLPTWVGLVGFAIVATTTKKLRTA